MAAADSRGVRRIGQGSRRVAAALSRQRDELLASALRLATVRVADVHRARVAARRLRSLLKTFQPLLDAHAVRPLRAELRSFAHALATVREADVRREMVLGLVRDGATFTPAARRRVRSVLDGARRQARSQLRQQFRAPGWAARLALLEAGLDSERLLDDRAAGSAQVLRRVNRTWREAVRLLERHPSAAAELHELRLALKHCRYALEAITDIAPAAAERLLGRLRAAQDAIGEHRDNELATGWVTENARVLGAPLSRSLLAALERREPELLAEAAEASERLLPAYRKWRAAVRQISRGSKRDRG
jgi:CHAD domain-containing protein